MSMQKNIIRALSCLSLCVLGSDIDRDQVRIRQREEVAINQQTFTGIEGVLLFKSLFAECAQSYEQQYQELLQRPKPDIEIFDDCTKLHNENVLYLIHRGYMGIDELGNLYYQYPR